MKTTMFIPVFLITWVAAYTQQGTTREQKAQRYLGETVFNTLNLNAGQKARALSILVSEYKSLDSLATAVQTADIQVIQSKRSAIVKGSEEQFKELLTDSQRTIYNTIAQRRPQGVEFGQTSNGQSNRFNGTPEMRAQQMVNSWIFESLKLTPDQKNQMQAILAQEYQSLDEIMSVVPQGLTIAERQDQIAALAPKLNPIKKDGEKKFLKLLSSDQEKTYQNTTSTRPPNRGFGDNYPIPVGMITQNPDVHDPVMAKEGNTYYLYYSNGGISCWSSKDLVNWKKEPPVFTTAPAWVQGAVPGFRGVGFWAPDITYYQGKFYMYYCASTFGRNSSAIGLVTNRTLNPSSPDYKWEDQGMVIQSIAGRDQWNAIDPNLAFDETGTPWLTFGSFWNGIKLVKLEKDLKSIAKPETWSTIATRATGSTAVEGPFIFKKGSYYYLFVSWDRCCQGTRSDYNIRVGRSEKITGPYLDKDGVDMAKGGGTLVLGGDVNEPKVVYALGHNSAYIFEGMDYLVFHKYVVEGAKLGILKMSWQDGWPFVQKQ